MTKLEGTLLPSAHIIEYAAISDRYVRNIYSRVTSNLIACNVRIINDDNYGSHGRTQLQKLTKYEDVAASYYASNGINVLKLDHFLTQPGALLPGQEKLHHTLRAVVGPRRYSEFTSISDEIRNSVCLNGIDMRTYPMCLYPPDFLLYKDDFFAFAEVKGMGDQLHLNQANWFINSFKWAVEFEICAVVSNSHLHLPLIVRAHEPGPTAKFHAELAKTDAAASQFRKESALWRGHLSSN